jgi:hypothetical protein
MSKARNIVLVLVEMKQRRFVKLDYFPGLDLTNFVKVLRQRHLKCFKIMYGIGRAIKTINDANVAHI